MKRFQAPIILIIFALAAPSYGRQTTPEKKPTESKPAEGKASDKKTEEPVTTHHVFGTGDRAFKYTATAGKIPILDRKGEPTAQIFFVAYTKDGVKEASQRPLMFSFNGGPGSASLWLHLGALGPKIVDLPDAKIAAPPYRLVDNPHSWLEKTDLVFIDPVATGYSRASAPELNSRFHGVQSDIDSIVEFIRMYISRNERWESPLFLVGESYGTTRAAGLSEALFERGIALNGIVLISAVLQFQTLDFDEANDLPYVLFLPTYTATAFYHKKLAPELLVDLRKTLTEARAWAESGYLSALQKGARLTEQERKEAVAKLARYTGLDAEFIEKSDLRVSIQRFCKQILAKDLAAVGRFDSRYSAFAVDPLAATPPFDPSYAAIRPAYTSAINQYLRKTLGYKTDTPYNVLGEEVGAWDWGVRSRGGYPSVASSLQSAIAQNPSMKVHVMSGYYDLATPFAAIEYTLDHMKLDEVGRKNLSISEYEGGHMMYLHPPSLAKMKTTIDAFLSEATAR
ncbi:MAG: hypothetical protein SFX72_12365 [Isosphaeraceae bacterium]|nr:hypothetical protein [Isosphaeraceae bacterium]